jgi:hypothetical protein
MNDGVHNLLLQYCVDTTLAIEMNSRGASKFIEPVATSTVIF